MMLAIKEAASDMSPYVRKTAAHAIPKLYRYVPALAFSPQGSHWFLNPKLTPALSQVLQAAPQSLKQYGKLRWRTVGAHTSGLIGMGYRR